MKRLLDNKGVSLIEIVAGLVLISIVAYPLSRLFINSFGFQAKSQINTEANKVNEYVAEQFKKGNFLTIKDQLEMWDEGISEEVINFAVDKLPSSDITAPYDISLKKISVKNISEAGEGENKVTAGGIKVPNNYSSILELTKDNSYTFRENITGITYSDKILTIGENTNNTNHDILIVNSSQKDVIIEVEKHIENAVRIYTTYTKNPEKPEEEYSVTLRQCTDPGLSRAQKTFTQINLGDKNDLSNKTEYLYEATITSVNRNDESITASMNVTFNMAIENE